MIKRLFHSLNLFPDNRVSGYQNSWFKRTGFSIAVVVFLFSILVILAVLQYRWSGQLSEAEYERMHSSLLASMNQFRIHFNDELQQPGFLLRPDTAILNQRDWKKYAENCTALLNMTDFRLIQNVYLWVAEIPGNDLQLLVLNREIEDYEPEPWPAELNGIKERYVSIFGNRMQGPPQMRPFIEITPDQVPYLIQPLILSEPLSTSATEERFLGFLLIKFNSEILLNERVPMLAQEYFGSRDGYMYQVAVAGRDRPEFLFQSDPDLKPDDFSTPDARLSLVDIPREPPGPGGQEAAIGRKPLPETSPDLSFTLPRPPPPVRNMIALRRRLSGREDFPWELLAKHREGSLEAAVAAMRHRNLALSFGGLLLLAASMALILISARRAQRLTRLQIDFVAGVSHELRTPLAVICSAGDNLAEGVVTESGKAIRNYGKLIRGEGRKLAAMVEQIMQFAGMRVGNRRYSLQPIQINRIVTEALEQMQPVLETAGFSVETDLAPDLPLANIDPSAMRQVLQNLIQNAVKYCGETRWLRIRTEALQTRRGTGIKVVVEDKGIGVDSKDLPHIFSPFYRGNAAMERQIHLSLIHI